MLHHDQSKIIPNEFIYHSDTRYTIDDGMMDDLIIPGTEHLHEFTHLENALSNKASIMSSTNYILNEDYFNTFSYTNQIPNLLTNSTNASNTNSLNNQFSYHTLQPSSQLQQSQNYNQYLQSNQAASSYLALGQTQASNQSSSTYIPKLITRSPSFNSSIGSSSASSPSSSTSSSSTSLSNIPQNALNTSITNKSSLSQSNSKDLLDYDSTGSASATNTASPNDPAEIVRLKQMRGQKLTTEEYQLLIKDRQRKDNHNMIERRRRFNINDRIKELGQLLPKNGEFDTKQNKGSILKASVDYISQLRIELDDFRKTVEANKYLLTLNKKLCNRIKELEMVCRAHGVDILSNQSQNNFNSYLISSPNIEKNEASSLLQHQHQTNNETHFSVTFSNSLDTLDENNNNNNNPNNTTCNINNSLEIPGIPPMSTQNNENTNSFTNNNIQIYEQSIPNNQSVPKGRKPKNTAKKRGNSEMSKASNETLSNKKSDLRTNLKEVKVPKQEPISPKNRPSPIDLYNNNQKQYVNVSNDSQEKNTGNGPLEDNENEVSSSPLVKLMTSNSKDPILTSSSVSSPSASPVPQSSTTPSSTTSSLSSTSSTVFFASNKSPSSPSSSSFIHMPCLVVNGNHCYN